MKMVEIWRIFKKLYEFSSIFLKAVANNRIVICCVDFIFIILKILLLSLLLTLNAWLCMIELDFKFQEKRIRDSNGSKIVVYCDVQIITDIHNLKAIYLSILAAIGYYCDDSISRKFEHSFYPDYASFLSRKTSLKWSDNCWLLLFPWFIFCLKYTVANIGLFIHWALILPDGVPYVAVLFKALMYITISLFGLLLVAGLPALRRGWRFYQIKRTATDIILIKQIKLALNAKKLKTVIVPRGKKEPQTETNSEPQPKSPFDFSNINDDATGTTTKTSTNGTTTSVTSDNAIPNSEYTSDFITSAINSTNSNVYGTSNTISASKTTSVDAEGNPILTTNTIPGSIKADDTDVSTTLPTFTFTSTNTSGATTSIIKTKTSIAGSKKLSKMNKNKSGQDPIKKSPRTSNEKNAVLEPDTSTKSPIPKKRRR